MNKTSGKKHSRGRPPKFKSVDELEVKIEAYFNSCWTQKIDHSGNPLYLRNRKGLKTNTPINIQTQPYTITGLAVFLGVDRDTLMNYQAKSEFFGTIKRAKQRCEAYAEEQLFIGKNVVGAIFNLKNNYGWKDKVETEHSGNLNWREEPPK